MGTSKIKNEMLVDKQLDCDKLMVSFLANISHEIRTPLNGVLGFLQLIRTGKLTLDKKKEACQLIEESSYYLLDVIDKIIDIYKIESGSFKVNKKDTSLKFILYDIYNFFKNSKKLFSEIRFQYYVNHYEDEVDIVSIDEVKTRKALKLLIDNAIKFTKKGKIEFGCHTYSNKILFFVKDTGIGIPSDYKEIIFEKFKQIDDSLTRKYGGLGLGLTIAKAAVCYQGGKIWYESEFNKGSNFFFVLPINNVSCF